MSILYIASCCKVCLGTATRSSVVSHVTCNQASFQAVVISKACKGCTRLVQSKQPLHVKRHLLQVTSLQQQQMTCCIRLMFSIWLPSKRKICLYAFRCSPCVHQFCPSQFFYEPVGSVLCSSESAYRAATMTGLCTLLAHFQTLAGWQACHVSPAHSKQACFTNRSQHPQMPSSIPKPCNKPIAPP